MCLVLLFVGKYRVKGLGVKYMVIEDDFTLGIGHTMHYSAHIS